MENHFMSFEHISTFIRSYRQANGESLQTLANRSGVSRSMIAQIESGQTSPTIAVLKKLATAMCIRLGDLVEPPKSLQVVNVFKPTQSNIITPENSAFVCHQLMVKNGSPPTDFYHFFFKDYGKTAFVANVSGAVKYLWVQQGILTIHLSSSSIVLQAGEMTTFDASTPHRFESKVGELAKGNFVVTYNS